MKDITAFNANKVLKMMFYLYRHYRHLQKNSDLLLQNIANYKCKTSNSQIVYPLISHHSYVYVCTMIFSGSFI
jgi:hypothetical protein